MSNELVHSKDPTKRYHLSSSCASYDEFAHLWKDKQRRYYKYGAKTRLTEGLLCAPFATLGRSDLYMDELTGLQNFDNLRRIDEKGVPIVNTNTNRFENVEAPPHSSNVLVFETYDNTESPYFHESGDSGSYVWTLRGDEYVVVGMIFGAVGNYSMAIPIWAVYTALGLSDLEKEERGEERRRT